MRQFNGVIAGLFFLISSAQAGETVWLDKLDASAGHIPGPWRVIQLSKSVPPTQYGVLRWDGVDAFEARADKSMALLGRPVTVDLKRTPILCWRWRVDAPLVTADLEQKSGDDFAARVYVAFTLPSSELSFTTRAKLMLARSLYGDAVPDAAINYVWDNRYPVGTRRPNAYTDRTQMIVAETGAAHAGRWMSARQDVQADFVKAFGETEGRLSLLAVAADTDNTGERAHSGFADFHFVARDTACFSN